MFLLKRGAEWSSRLYHASAGRKAEALPLSLEPQSSAIAGTVFSSHANTW